jgi:hypothetical protein
VNDENTVFTDANRMHVKNTDKDLAEAEDWAPPPIESLIEEQKR